MVSAEMRGLKGFCPLHPEGHQVSLKAGSRGSQSCQYPFEL